jgi:hypothetical protein
VSYRSNSGKLRLAERRNSIEEKQVDRTLFTGASAFLELNFTSYKSKLIDKH